MSFFQVLRRTCEVFLVQQIQPLFGPCCTLLTDFGRPEGPSFLSFSSFLSFDLWPWSLTEMTRMTKMTAMTESRKNVRIG